MAAAATRRGARVTGVHNHLEGVHNHLEGVHNHLEVVLPDGDYPDDVKLATAVNNALAQKVTVPDGWRRPLWTATSP
jgi:hypothetical protein